MNAHLLLGLMRQLGQPRAGNQGELIWKPSAFNPPNPPFIPLEAVFVNTDSFFEHCECLMFVVGHEWRLFQRRLPEF
jgi:hypothetical protein